MQETFTVFLGDFLQGFQAVCRKCRTQHLHRCHTGLCPLLQKFVGIGLHPLLATETGLETASPATFRQLQRRRHRRRRGATTLRIRVTLFCIGLGNAMEGKQQAIGTAVLITMRLDRRRQCGDINGMPVVILDHGDCRQVALPGQPACQGIVDRPRRRCRILGKQRQHNHLLDTARTQFFQRTGNRRITVTHRRQHMDVRLRQAGCELALHQRTLLAQDAAHRRIALGVPDAAIQGGHPTRPERQDEGIENQPPDGARHFDHAGVGKEFTQVAPHGGRRRRIGSAKIGQQDTQLATRRNSHWSSRRWGVPGFKQIRPCTRSRQALAAQRPA